MTRALPDALQPAQLPFMKPRSTLTVVALIAAGCGGADARYSFTGVVTACETEEWAATRADLIEDGETAEADRFSSGRCFNIDVTRPVHADLGLLGFLGGSDRVVEVSAINGSALEHPASVALRLTLGQEPRTTGWVQRSALVEAP